MGKFPTFADKKSVEKKRRNPFAGVYSCICYRIDIPLGINTHAL